MADDPAVRLAAFDWLEEQVAIYGDVIPRAVLQTGFSYSGARVPLLGPQGIFKPQVMTEMPLSITTSPRGPYDDDITEEGLISYKYRGEDPNHRENAGLRRAMETQTPLVYFHGVVPGQYFAANTVTFLVPFANLGSPPAGSPAHNVFASSFAGAIVDVAPGGPGIDAIVRPRFGSPYTVQPN